MSIEEQIKIIARSIDRLFPHGHSIEVCVRRYAHPPDVVIAIHGLKSYAEATEVCRAFGVGDREKSTYSDMSKYGRTVLQGKIAKDIKLLVFSDGLPPSCRLEKTVERVPKSETKETGEFVEIERTRVVCDQTTGPARPAAE